VWSPSLKRDVTLIEQVQRRFTKRLRGYRDLSYHDRLNKLNLETFELRRVKSDLLLCYKIIFDIVHLNKHDFFDISTTTTRGHRCKIYKRLTVALSDRISFVKELSTSGIGCPWTVLISVLFIVLEILLMP